jgi:hypothetical protein
MPPDDPTYFKKIKLGKKHTKTLRKVNKLKIQVIIYILCAINDCIL